MNLPRLYCLTCIILLPSGVTAEDDATVPETISIRDRIPYGRQPVDYFSQTTNDAVSRLQEKLNAGDISLKSGPSGYLRSVLQALDVPVSSQLLVYSKTARAPNLVTPQTPRAVYFNDEVTVAWIPEARELELTAVDPVKGANFYTLSQPLAETDDERVPDAIRFERRDRCLACHAGQSSLEVPGLLLRAFQTDRSGKPLFGFSRITHDSTYNRRWGGWYVTGAPRKLNHRGNLVSRADNEEDKRNPGFRSPLSTVSDAVDLAKYPYITETSDVIAHMVFAHQMHGLNLIIRVGMEARLRRRSDAEDRLIRYLVFADEPELPAQISRVKSRFADWFENVQSPANERSSLRQLNLQTRLARNRLSWLIDHPTFQALPEATYDRIMAQLLHGVSAKESPDGFSHLAPDEKSRLAALLSSREQVRSSQPIQSKPPDSADM